MKGLLKLRLTREMWTEIEHFLNAGDFDHRISMVLDTILGCDLALKKEMDELGVNRSDRKQVRSFFKHDVLPFNGHPRAEAIEQAHRETGQVREELRQVVYHVALDKMLRLAEDGV
jgi:hypothetical protein